MLQVYNIRGQLVEVLEDRMMKAGNHTCVWTPDELATGVYFVELKSGQFREVMKVGYLK